MSAQFTKVGQVMKAVARELRVPEPQHAQDYPRDQGWKHGMGHTSAPRGLERRYWVKLPDGRKFFGTKDRLLEWANLHLHSEVS
jgi:hypothetical protein